MYRETSKSPTRVRADPIIRLASAILDTCLGSARRLDRKNADRHRDELSSLEQGYRGAWDNLEHAARIFADDGYELAPYDAIAESLVHRFTPYKTVRRVTVGSALAFLLLSGDLRVPVVKIRWRDLRRASEALAFLDGLP